MNTFKWVRVLGLVILAGPIAGASAADVQLVILDNDWNVPGSYIGQAAVLPLLASPRVKVLGLTTVTGDSWRDEGAASLLRFLELIGAPTIPVANGAVFPLVNTQARMAAWERIHGFIFWKGAWNGTDTEPASHPLDPYKITPPREGMPHIRVIDETAADFMIRQVHAHPHEVTIYEAGPMTNLAVAISLDPEFAGLAKGLIFQGAAVAQAVSVDGFHSDFNIIFDPEAAHIVLAARWAKIVALSEVSNPFIFDKALLARIQAHRTPAGDYLARNSDLTLPLWEVLGSAVIADPSLITRTADVQMDVDTDHGMSYGRVVIGGKAANPRIGVADVTLIQAVDGPRFIDEYVAAVQTDLRAAAK